MNSERSDGKLKSCCWSVTINNPTDDDKAQWAALSGLPWVREVSGQLEQGSGGTLHLQGMVKTQSVRFSQVKKALPRAHIEAARSPAALAKYVSKTETRVASVPTMKVASQLDVQRCCFARVMQQCYQIEERNSSKLIDPLDYDEGELILKHADVLRKYWEIYVDDAVRDLVKAGYFGVEYVMANPQVRTAFRKYLPEICYRFYNASKSEQAPQQSQEGTLTPQGTPEGEGSDPSSDGQGNSG